MTIPLGEILTETGLVIPPDATLPDCLGIATQLASLRRASRWSVGDVVVAIETRFGDAGTQRLDETGLSPQSIANCAWVSRRVRPEIRRADLPWSLHSLVARLEDAFEQRKWLAQAAEHHWTREEFSAALRNATQGQVGEDPPERVERVAWTEAQKETLGHRLERELRDWLWRMIQDHTVAVADPAGADREVEAESGRLTRLVEGVLRDGKRKAHSTAPTGERT